MTHLYHYCAVWHNPENSISHAGGVMKTEYTVTFENYPQFVERVAKEYDQEQITITSLSYLGQEE